MKCTKRRVNVSSPYGHLDDLSWSCHVWPQIEGYKVVDPIKVLCGKQSVDLES